MWTKISRTNNKCLSWFRSASAIQESLCRWIPQSNESSADSYRLKTGKCSYVTFAVSWAQIEAILLGNHLTRDRRYNPSRLILSANCCRSRGENSVLISSAGSWASAQYDPSNPTLHTVPAVVPSYLQLSQRSSNFSQQRDRKGTVGGWGLEDSFLPRFNARTLRGLLVSPRTLSLIITGNYWPNKLNDKIMYLHWLLLWQVSSGTHTDTYWESHSSVYWIYRWNYQSTHSNSTSRA